MNYQADTSSNTRSCAPYVVALAIGLAFGLTTRSAKAYSCYEEPPAWVFEQVTVNGSTDALSEVIYLVQVDSANAWAVSNERVPLASVTTLRLEEGN